jgi:antirestriction protein ArdC
VSAYKTKGRYEATEERAAAAKARRDRFREMVNAVGKMTDDQRAALAARMGGVVNPQGHAFSMANTILLAFQAGERRLTIVGGFRQWLKNGRAVRKGEHGFAIWIPVKPRAEEGEDEPSGGDGVRFFMGTVFDISQTDEIQKKEA